MSELSKSGFRHNVWIPCHQVLLGEGKMIEHQIVATSPTAVLPNRYLFRVVSITPGQRQQKIIPTRRITRAEFMTKYKQAIKLGST